MRRSLSIWFPPLCMMGGPFLNNETSFLAKIQLNEISNINQNGACFEFPYVPIAAVITLEKAFILQTVLFVSVLFFWRKKPHIKQQGKTEVPWATKLVLMFSNLEVWQPLPEHSGTPVSRKNFWKMLFSYPQGWLRPQLFSMCWRLIAMSCPCLSRILEMEHFVFRHNFKKC